MKNIGNTDERPQALTGGADQIRTSGISAAHHPIASMKTTDDALAPREAPTISTFRQDFSFIGGFNLIKVIIASSAKFHHCRRKVDVRQPPG